LQKIELTFCLLKIIELRNQSSRIWQCYRHGNKKPERKELAELVVI